MMRSVSIVLLVVLVAQLSYLTVEAFSIIGATKVVAPVKAKAKPAAAAKKTAPKKAAPKKIQLKGKSKAAGGPAKAKTVAAAKAKADLKAKTKAKVDAKAKANAVIRAKNVASEKRKAADKVAARKKAEEKAKKAAQAKARNVKATTSEAAFNIANSNMDASMAVTKNFKPKKNKKKTALFPGLQASGPKAKSAFKKGTPAKNVVAKEVKVTDAKDAGLLNPLEFGLQVVQSEKGQEAAGILIEGGLKFVEAILEEGKKSKVIIPRGYDSGTGAIKNPKISNIGYKELLDAGIFAGTEFFGLAKTNYEKFYVGPGEQAQTPVYKIPAKVDKNGKVIKPASENFVVKINGQRVVIKK